MGKQYNKLIKRRRRSQYLNRLKDREASGSLTRKSTKPAKKSSGDSEGAKKAAAKKTAAKKATAKKAAKKAPAKKIAATVDPALLEATAAEPAAVESLPLPEPSPVDSSPEAPPLSDLPPEDEEPTPGV